MRIEDFVTRYLDGYLFSDLTTMRAARPAMGDDGHLGYPMLLACAAGIEVLGILVATTPFKAHKPAKNFLRYWEQHLYTGGPRLAVGEAVYELVRHGIAHNFATKVAFAVSKSGKNHLTTAGETTTIDVLALADDLWLSFDRRIRPIVCGSPAFGISAATMQDRLNEIEADNVDWYLPHQAALAALPQPPAAEPSVPITASGLNLGVTASSIGIGTPPPKLTTP